ncbi:MAG: hypothetical protein COA58_07120 [Bacteroidetes bacterium]|nr:MAG: hypothetical protein COA58_07120 [Bacteroidota bacterium]
MLTKLFTILSFLILASTVDSHAQVEFQKISLEEAKVQARAQNKLILLDFWAIWCKPCIAMERETFSNKEVGDAINPRYISLKLDVDYFENMDIKEEYNVSVMPTILIINSRGEVQNRLIGQKSPEALLSELNLSSSKGTVVDVEPTRSNSGGKIKKECFLKRWWRKITS